MGSSTETVNNHSTWSSDAKPAMALGNLEPTKVKTRHCLFARSHVWSKTLVNQEDWNFARPQRASTDAWKDQKKDRAVQHWIDED